MQVGTKVLKNRLSHYLRQVRAGEVVRVTDHGNVVAELRPVSSPLRGESVVLQALEAEGLLARGAGPARDFAPVRTRSRHRASDIVIEDRR